MKINFKVKTRLQDETLISRLVSIEIEKEHTLFYYSDTNEHVHITIHENTTGNEVLSFTCLSNQEDFDEKIKNLLNNLYKKLLTESAELERRRKETIFRSGMFLDDFVKAQEYISDIPIHDIIDEINMIHQISHLIKKNNIIQ